ncbi:MULTISPECIES: hypothetical protein [unclassified Rhizobium]|uniref:hypothetical protein n=1 Tax=unclassified Rhizobium TaxID=2613769 RepID=UPI00382351CF
MGWLLNLINPLGKIIDGLNAAYKAKLQAQNDADRVDAEKQIAFFQGQIELATQAAQSDRWWSPRSLMGFCATIYVAKIVVYDTVLQLGVTPNPGGQVTGIVLTVIGFYFGSKTVSDVAGKLIGAWARK